MKHLDPKFELVPANHIRLRIFSVYKTMRTKRTLSATVSPCKILQPELNSNFLRWVWSKLTNITQNFDTCWDWRWPSHNHATFSLLTSASFTLRRHMSRKSRHVGCQTAGGGGHSALAEQWQKQGRTFTLPTKNSVSPLQNRTLSVPPHLGWYIWWIAKTGQAQLRKQSHCLIAKKISLWNIFHDCRTSVLLARVVRPECLSPRNDFARKKALSSLLYVSSLLSLKTNGGCCCCQFFFTIQPWVLASFQALSTMKTVIDR